MNNPLGVSPSKGNQGTTRGKEKIFWPRWESNPSKVCFSNFLEFSRRSSNHQQLYWKKQSASSFWTILLVSDLSISMALHFGLGNVIFIFKAMALQKNSLNIKYQGYSLRREPNFLPWSFRSLWQVSNICCFILFTACPCLLRTKWTLSTRSRPSTISFNLWTGFVL